MSVKNRNSKIKLPIPGDGEARKLAAKRMAEKAIKKKCFKTKRVQPASLVVALLGSGGIGAGDNHQSYFAAYVEHKVAEAAEEEEVNSSEAEANKQKVSCEALGMPYRPLYIEAELCRWDTEWERLKLTDSDNEVEWDPVSDKDKDEYRGQKIESGEWVDWSTNFLVFASELKVHRRMAARQKNRQPSSNAGRGGTAWRLGTPLLEKRLRQFSQACPAGVNGRITCEEVAKAIKTSRQTAGAFLRQAGDWLRDGKGWIEKEGKARNTKYALTEKGVDHLGKIGF